MIEQNDDLIKLRTLATYFTLIQLNGYTLKINKEQIDSLAELVVELMSKYD